MKEVQIIKASKDKVIRSGAIIKNKIRVAPYARVSTDSDEQKNSYESQKKYYQELVSNNPEWELVDIYADEAISGTQVYKRTDFIRMINDAMEGKFDMIITKSISRFARNTLDTLSYVRQLKDKGVAVFFEKENINTLTMNGELLLVILSSLAQQESESIGGNIKLGLKMKMSRGEMVGFNRCLGYSYDKDTKEISIVPEEAEIVRYIFKRYIEGTGTYALAKELLKTFGNLFINDGLSQIGIGNHVSNAEIMTDKYNVIEIFNGKDKIDNYEKLMDKYKIKKVEDLVTAWAFFSDSNPGECICVDEDGKSVYDAIEVLTKESGLYFAERR